jgi:3-hydroxyisobutyrate dehydrogenase-like beta-hydroxyacid dehydrogenase
VALIRKDLALALEAAEQCKATIKFGEHSLEYYRDLEKKGYAKKDFGFVYQYIHKNLKM